LLLRAGNTGNNGRNAFSAAAAAAKHKASDQFKATWRHEI
jgi:hypothetical protein